MSSDEHAAAADTEIAELRAALEHERLINHAERCDPDGGYHLDHQPGRDNASFPPACWCPPPWILGPRSTLTGKPFRYRQKFSGSEDAVSITGVRAFNAARLKRPGSTGRPT